MREFTSQPGAVNLRLVLPEGYRPLVLAALPASDFTDPTTKEIPKANAYSELPGEGINALIKRGMNFAVCQMSAETIARMIAMAINGDPDHILAEMNAKPAPMAGSLHHILW
jgi:hypothetical protein